MAKMTSELLTRSPSITGMDPSIIISPQRLHLTLGVMTLSESKPDITSAKPQDKSVVTDGASDAPLQGEPKITRRTTSEAIELLQQLAPEIRQILEDQPLQLLLDEIAVMRRSKSGEADVMYLGPSDMAAKAEEHAQTFKALRKSLYFKPEYVFFQPDSKTLYMRDFVKLALLRRRAH